MKIVSDYQYSLEGCTADDLLAAIVQAGHSNTRARRAVLAALCEANGQATPAQLLALGRVHQPNLGLITVYRTLEILSVLGLVRKLHLDEGCSTYALSPAGVLHADGEMGRSARGTHAHSHHVICQRCRRATEFAGCELDGVVAAGDVEVVRPARAESQRSRGVGVAELVGDLQRTELQVGDARRKIDAQMPARDKIGSADYLIETSGSFERTLAQAEAVWTMLLDDASRCSSRRRRAVES